MATPNRYTFMALRTHDDWKACIQNLLKTNDKALLRSVVAIYNRQTLDERINGQSAERNGIGFSRWDAEEMSDIAVKIKNGVPLKQNEIVHSRIVMPKYWRQLMVISKQTVDRWREEEYNAIMSEDKERFCKSNEAMVQCMEQGVACSYGICDECIVNQGVQIHM